MWIVTVAVAVVYLLACAVIYFTQARLIYYPSRTIVSTPRDVGLEFEEVLLTADDGIRIHGWFIPAKSSRATLLFCHGNGGNISHRLESILQFHGLGLSVFIFDYHGYGQSDGAPGERQTYLDASAAWDYLIKTRGLSGDSIVIFGRSLGGAVAAWLAGQKRPKAVIIESSFTSIPDVAAGYYRLFPVRLLSRYIYNTKEYVAHISVPILVIHSLDDDLVPFDHGRKLYESANQPKQFLQINGGHNDGYLTTGDQYLQGLARFLSTYVTAE